MNQQKHGNDLDEYNVNIKALLYYYFPYVFAVFVFAALLHSDAQQN